MTVTTKWIKSMVTVNFIGNQVINTKEIITKMNVKVMEQWNGVMAAVILATGKTEYSMVLVSCNSRMGQKEQDFSNTIYLLFL